MSIKRSGSFGSQNFIHPISMSVYRNARCKFEKCLRWFSYAHHKTGIDILYCPEHRRLMREQEAEELIKHNPTLVDKFAI